MSCMNWKEFFRPTCWKMFVSIGIFLLLNMFFFPLEASGGCLDYFGNPCFDLKPGINFIHIFDYSKYMQSSNINVPYEMLYLAFSFLIACTIMDFSQKRKKIKKKKK